MATAAAGDEKSSVNGITSESQTKNLTDLPAELLEHILCLPVLHDIDICNVSCCCKRLHDVCHEVGTVWANQFKLRWCFNAIPLEVFGSVGLRSTVLCVLCYMCLVIVFYFASLHVSLNILMTHSIHHQYRPLASFYLLSTHLKDLS